MFEAIKENWVRVYLKADKKRAERLVKEAYPECRLYKARPGGKKKEKAD